MTRSEKVFFSNVPGGLNGCLGFDVTLDLCHIHVGGVRELRGKSVVFEDDGLEHLLEVLVGVLISGVDTAVLHEEINNLNLGTWTI